MYTNVSSGLAALMADSDGCTYLAQIRENETPKSCTVRSMKLSMGGNGANYITMGTAYCASAELTLYGVSFEMRDHEYEIRIGMDVNGTAEYVPMGLFTAEKPVLDGENIKVTLYDRMKKFEKAYFSSLTYPASIADIVGEICTQCSVPYVSFSSSVAVGTKPEGYTCREMVSYIAQLIGCFAVINRSGSLEFRWYSGTAARTLSAGQYWDPFDRSENNYTLHRIAVVVGKVTGQDGRAVDNTLVASGSTGAKGIVFENPFYTQDRLNSVFNLRKNFTFRPGTVKALGDPRIDPGDTITVAGMDGNNYTLPVMTIDYEFDGGLSMKIGAVGEEEMKDDFSVKGPNTQAVERLAAELVMANRILANKIDADVVTANYATIGSLNATNAEIENLSAVVGDFESIKTGSLTSVTAYISDLKASLFDAGYGHVTMLEADMADIIHLLANNASATSVSTIQLSSANATIDSAFLRNLISSNITVNDLLAGTIYTNKHTVQSQDGAMVLTGSLLTFKDADGNVRIQIGKDGQGNYNYYLVNADGDIVWDASGITADGVPDGLIVDDMVASSGNGYNGISASKLNIQSVVGGINTAGGLSTSSIVLDDTSQTLTVAFTNMKDDVDSLKVGGRNLFINTLIPDVSSNFTLPRLVGQSGATSRSGTPTTAEHGVRLTRGSAGYPRIYFGSDTASSMTMNGLEAGETYTWSFDTTFKLYSAYTGSSNFSLRARFCWIKESAPNTVQTNDYTVRKIYNNEIGTELSARCEYAFTVPDDAIGIYLTVVGGSTVSSYYASDDFIELRNIKLEKGSVATPWSPAPEDVADQIQQVSDDLADQIQQVSDEVAEVYGIGIGGRNLIRNTLKPDVSTSAGRPKLIGQNLNTAISSNSNISASEHGIKIQVNSAIMPYIRFGTSTYSSADMNGLKAGETYTLSFDANWKLYSGDSTSSDRTFVAYLYDNRGGSTSFVNYESMRSVIGTITSDDKGTEMSARCEFTFTIPDDVTKLRLEIKPASTTTSYYPAGDYFELKNLKLEKGGKATDWTPAPEDYLKEMSSLADLIDDVQDQIDGVVDTYYYAYAPTLNNVPASGWSSSDYPAHEGDMFLDTSTGKSYRFLLNTSTNTWEWKEIPDTASAQALAAAQDAKDLADHKRRVFTATPYPPYDAGDLWFSGANGDILTCTTAKNSNGSYDAGDWTKLNKYTDDTTATNYYTTLNTSLGQIESRVGSVETTVSGQATTINSHSSQITQTQDKIAAIISDSQISDLPSGTTMYSKLASVETTVNGTVTRLSQLNVGDGTIESFVANYNQTISEFSVSISNAATKAETVTSVSVEYAFGNSATTAPQSGWSTSSPTWTTGKYIWQRTAITKNGSTTYSNVTCIQGAKGEKGDTGNDGNDGADGIDGIDGADGNDGADGADGVSITGVTAQYYLSNSDSVLSGGSWSDTPPTWSSGKYLWTRSKIAYSNNTVSYTDPALDQINTDLEERVSTAELKITSDAIVSTVKQYGASSWNLLDINDLVASNATKTQSGFSVTVASSANYGGIYIPSSVFEASTQYTLSYKFRKTDGTLSNIGWAGASGRFVFDRITVDGTESTSIPHDLSNDANEHTVVVTFTTKASLDSLHIQANRASATAVTVKYWDLQLEKGGTASAWSPCTLDSASYISQTADEIRMKADKLTWTATNSSLDASGKLIVNSADIGGIHVSSSSIYSGSKSTLASTSAGFYMGSNGKVNIGDGSNYLKWGGSELEIKGKVIINAGGFGSIKTSSNGVYVYDSTNDVMTLLSKNGLELYTPESPPVETVYGITTEPTAQDTLVSIRKTGIWTKSLVVGINQISGELVQEIKYVEIGQGIRTYGSAGYLTVDGLTTFNGNVVFGTGAKMIFGGSNSSWIGRDGNTGYIKLGQLGSMVSSGNPLVLDGNDRLRYMSGSSRRFKNLIGEIQNEEAEKLLSLHVVDFVYKPGYLDENDENNGRTMTGLFAEDVANLFPDAVYHRNGLVENYIDRQLLVRLIKLCQIQQQEIDALKKGVA